MLTSREIWSLLAAILVAAIIAGIGRWRRWAWSLPAAAGAGFLVGFGVIGIPKLPPADGTDWLFWAGIGLTFLAVIQSAVGGWHWAFGAVAGPVVLLILRPIVPGGLGTGSWWGCGISAAALGVLLVWTVAWAELRIGSIWTVLALSIVLGGTGVMIFASNLRVVGVYGMCAAAATAATAIFSRNGNGASVAVLSIPLLAALLAGGHYYPDPGVTWPHLTVLLASPLLFLPAAILPGRRTWPRAIIALILVAAAVSAVTIPTALAAKKAAGEDDPYAGYK